MPSWSPSQYLKFEDQRTRPAAELVARVPLEAAKKIVDIGCGPGNSTELLVNRWADAAVSGFDTSDDMLEAARRRLPGCRFFTADVAGWSPDGDEDLLYSNAVFQWVPGHLDVLERLLAALKPGAVLAVQMPDNLGEPSHVAMAETAADGPWADRLEAAGLARDPLPGKEVYYDRLAPWSASFDIWHTIYTHPLDGAAAIVEWVKGTGLRPYVDPLDEGDRQAFLAAYESRIAAAYPVRSDGKALLWFPRLFLVAVRNGRVAPTGP
ncbi:trans-aconitate 2-methyltransferase [Microbaculum marinum]|uniref:Trans-aconitate 2-methyltransferase n=1 Tax=Microbaculum marinum TaxID=1764581 RepID=A0AAW9RV85_9HYPH